MKSTLIKVALPLMAIISCSAQAAMNFNDYPAAVYTGPRHIASTPLTRELKSTFKEMSGSQIDFAGEYVTGAIGCGTGCATTLLLNVRTGQPLKPAFKLNTDVVCTDGSDGGMATRPNSKLMIVKGAVISGYYSGDPVACTREFYLEKDGRLVRLK